MNNLHAHTQAAQPLCRLLHKVSWPSFPSLLPALPPKVNEPQLESLVLQVCSKHTETPSCSAGRGRRLLLSQAPTLTPHVCVTFQACHFSKAVYITPRQLLEVPEHIPLKVPEHTRSNSFPVTIG